jgi:hypothetical protein
MACSADNMKAYLRKAQALKALRRDDEMFRLLETAILRCGFRSFVAHLLAGCTLLYRTVCQ